ncbi:MAG: hypothetical protein J6C28_03640 [Bacilli bacterium]|nr:hypothetical protein [Bacilli bacterium]
MKKNIIISLIFLVIGIILGTKIISLSKIEDVFQNETIYYFLQEGVYTTEEILNENTESLNIKLINKDENKYYVYLGITKDVENAKKIKKIYKNKGYDIYIEEKTLSNEEFSSNITQFDLLINSTNNEEEILKITEVVLANYEEIIKKQ